jgi:hypothetical protein
MGKNDGGITSGDAERILSEMLDRRGGGERREDAKEWRNVLFQNVKETADRTSKLEEHVTQMRICLSGLKKDHEKSESDRKRMEKVLDSVEKAVDFIKENGCLQLKNHKNTLDEIHASEMLPDPWPTTWPALISKLPPGSLLGAFVIALLLFLLLEITGAIDLIGWLP